MRCWLNSCGWSESSSIYSNLIPLRKRSMRARLWAWLCSLFAAMGRAVTMCAQPAQRLVALCCLMCDVSFSPFLIFRFFVSCG